MKKMRKREEEKKIKIKNKIKKNEKKWFGKLK